MIAAAAPNEMIVLVRMTPDKDDFAHGTLIVASDDQRFVHPLIHLALEQTEDTACPWCNQHSVLAPNAHKLLLTPEDIRR